MSTINDGGPAGWDRKDAWWKHGRDFMVEVRHHMEPMREAFGEGPHRWCVYAYIYPRHPHFAAFSGPNMWQEAATCLPFHCGPSKLEYPMYDGKVTAVKVGADYNHLHDAPFTQFATPDEAWEVFNDAERLFVMLQARSDEKWGG